MTKAATWELDGEVYEDSGDVGGDIQVGPAFSARFKSADCPEARFEIELYATAKTYMELGEEEPACPHKAVLLESLDNGAGRFAPLPEEHLACTYKPGTVDVQQRTTYRRNGHMIEGNYESDDADDIYYEWSGSDVGYRADTLTEEIRLATADAKEQMAEWVVEINKFLVWDGRSPVNG